MDKLHQLFQSTYFLQSGNYKAAIRIYQQLLELFDHNPGRMLNPPLHYLDAVLGVLDSLLSAGLYDEMPFFIAKLHRLTESDYPQEFVRKVLAFIYLYDSFRLINCGLSPMRRNFISNMRRPCSANCRSKNSMSNCCCNSIWSCCIWCATGWRSPQGHDPDPGDRARVL